MSVLGADEPIQVPDDIVALAKRVNHDPLTWFHQCHRASLVLVKAGIFGPSARVARGSCIGVLGQHSWIVVPPVDNGRWRESLEGGLVYHPEARVIDPTLWSYDPFVTGLFESDNTLNRHRPHGTGDIWDYGPPRTAKESGEKPIRLNLASPLSSSASLFLDLCGPLGRRGWSDLANGPMQGWPSSEIIAAMGNTEGLSALIPIDVLGHVTDRNPEGMYF